MLCYNQTTMPNTPFDKEFERLNKEQKKVVETIDGPLLVVAGPGSGKTQVLSLRVGRILRETDMRPSNILCLTFTESAAVNMRQRLAGLIGQEAYRVAIHTFHNFCVDIIGRYPHFFYGGAFFQPADTLVQYDILEDIIKSLPSGDPLRSEHPEQGFVYLKPALDAIGALKKGGMSPAEFSDLLDKNNEEYEKCQDLVGEVFGGTLSKKSFGAVSGLLDELRRIYSGNVKSKKSLEGTEDLNLGDYRKSFTYHLAESLARALDESVNAENTKALSSWKSERTTKEDLGGGETCRILKEVSQQDRLRSLSHIYKLYREEMHRRGFYDFDDMLLDVISAIEKNPTLRYEIQEQFQYILVDEFQDTNGAQMKLIELIVSAPVNEGRPNIMVVGDDDQAIYKFQGADVSNILDFKKNFVDVTTVTLTANYRSTQDILDVASEIISKGEHRLSRLLPDMEKVLVSKNKELGGGRIVSRVFPTNAHEFHYVSREIAKLIEDGVKPSDIAIITRRHRELEAMVPYLKGSNVPVSYEREQDVFLEPHIIQLISMARFTASLLQKEQDEADIFLPEILSFPFWEIPRQKIWEISRAARGAAWIGVMLDDIDSKIQNIARFFLDLSAKANYAPLEMILDDLIGAHTPLAVDNENDDGGDDIDDDTNDEHNSGDKSGDKNISKNSQKNQAFFSPFKSYYFSKEKFDHSRAEYLSFLSSLRVFVRSLREYKSGEILSLKDLIEFVDIHKKNKIPLNDRSPFVNADQAVNLLTAHKAKGLEFDTVFILSCQDEVWTGRGRVKMLPFPLNLQIYPAGDNIDDQLRLFYVALTRAKKHLYLTSYKNDESGSESLRLQFLVPKEKSETTSDILQNIYNPEIITGTEAGAPTTHDVLTASWLRYNTAPFLGEEAALLKTLVKDYKMSVTHLNNFLNVSRGGPELFLGQNLLRFPQAKTTSGSYGTAMHKVMEKIYSIVKNDSKGKAPELTEVLECFEESLRRERMTKLDFAEFLEKGKKALTEFYTKKSDKFLSTDRSEVDFKEQGVVVHPYSPREKEPAFLTGKIDKMVVGGVLNSSTPIGTIEVHDFKTGKPKEKWTGTNPGEKIQLYEYERQLTFYKILVEGSREFGEKYKVNKGVLEFVQPNKRDQLLDLSLDIDSEKSERLQKLISIVYNKILNLDFPETKKYPQDLEGIKAFEEDLLSGNI